jgi:signal transduction histidine kinase
MADDRLKILIVDDDDVDRMAVRRALKASGLDVIITEAEDADSALARLTSGHFDCTLLDYRMPGSDGLEVVRRAREKGVMTPFIMLTGFGDEQTAVELMKAGAADYIPKNSLTSERLAVSLRGVVRVHQAEIEASKADTELRRYADRLRAVATAAIEMNSTLAVDAMLQATTENARRILNARYAETRLTADVNPSSDALQAQTAMWRASAPSEGEQELTSWADATRDEMPGITPEILALLAAHPDSPGIIPSTGFHVPSTLTADLAGRDGRKLGTIQLWDKKEAGAFDEADEAILTQLAQLASVALENARLFRAALDATRARDDLVAIVSHDLRNPIHTIHMAASFLLDIAPTNDRRLQARRQLEVIQRSATRANRLIQDLLDVARIQAGGLAVDPIPVDVRSLVQEAVDSATPLATAASLRVECEVPEQTPRVSSDRERVLQVFANLIGNAIKFTPKGGEIRILASLEDSNIRFIVADTGPGIPPEHLNHVFDRYWQAKSTAKLGTGLGLSIAKGIVEAHGGRIWVESPPNAGAQFNFTLPAAGWPA